MMWVFETMHPVDPFIDWEVTANDGPSSVFHFLQHASVLDIPDAKPGCMLSTEQL